MARTPPPLSLPPGLFKKFSILEAGNDDFDDGTDARQDGRREHDGVSRPLPRRRDEDEIAALWTGGNEKDCVVLGMIARQTAIEMSIDGSDVSDVGDFGSSWRRT